MNRSALDTVRLARAEAARAAVKAARSREGTVPMEDLADETERQANKREKRTGNPGGAGRAPGSA